MQAQGTQTLDFVSRLEKNRPNLPPVIVEMAEEMARTVEKHELPTRGTIASLHATLREILGERDTIVETCGNEGRYCSMCPFGAYIPEEFSHASEKAPICLPWIAINLGE